MRGGRRGGRNGWIVVVGGGGDEEKAVVNRKTNGEVEVCRDESDELVGVERENSNR